MSSATGFTFNKSTRYHKARFALVFAGKKQTIWLAATILLAAAGLWLLLQDIRLGYLSLGLALSIGMLIIWRHWELEELAVPNNPPAQALDQILAGDVLGRLHWPTNPRQLWQSLEKNWRWRFIVQRFGIDTSRISTQLTDKEADLHRVWQMAAELRGRLGLPAITAANLTVSLIANSAGSQTYLAGLQLSVEDLVNGVLWLERVEAVVQRAHQKANFGGLGRDWAAGFTPLLNHFAHNLSAEVEAVGELHLNTQLHGEVLPAIITSLSQPTKNSTVVLGDVGSGKTTMVYNLAEKLLSGEAPPSLRYHKLMELNASTIISQVRARGELEQLVLQLLTEAVKAKNIIIFLDNAHLFFSDEAGGVNLTNILLPILEGGRLRLLLAMEPQQWQKLIATAPTMTALLNQQTLPVAQAAAVLNVLEDQALVIEGRSKTFILYQAIQEAYRLADRYISDQVFPGKAITLLSSAANFATSGVVTPLSVQKAIESSLGVKVAAPSGGEKAQLLNLEEQLHQRMVNQDYAVQVVSSALRRARAGVRNPSRPVGSFLFLGPTGVGKTELSKALADIYFGGVGQIVRVDMSEYARAEDSSRLLEPSQQNTAGFLNQVRQKPFSVVLLDEVEKAHPDILNLLLQMLDEGHLTDTAGRQASFRDAIVIATSNAGADEIRKRIEAGQQLEQFSDQFVNNLINSKQFRPELINRFDEVVLFRPLTPEELKRVVALILAEVNQTLAQQKVAVSLTPAAIDWLAKQGYDPRLGARPLRRIMQRSVENLVANRLLSGQLSPGGTAQLDVADLEQAGANQASA